MVPSSHFSCASSYYRALAHRRLDDQWDKMDERWEKMGLDEEAVKERGRVMVEAGIDRPLKEMGEEEDRTIQAICDKIEQHGNERARLARELAAELEEPDSGLGLVSLERLLRKEVQDLRTKKEKHMAEVLELKRQDKAICRVLSDVEPFPISSSVIPTKEQMEALKSHLQEVQALKNQRQGRFVEMKLSILALLEKLEAEPESSFERTVACEEDEAVVLSVANLDSVETFLARLEAELEKNKRHGEQMRDRILSLVDKLELGVDVKVDVADNLAGHSPTELKEVWKLLHCYR